MTPQERVARLVQGLHCEFGMSEMDIVMLLTEGAYQYFEQLRSFRNLVEYTEELGLYSPKEE